MEQFALGGKKNQTEKKLVKQPLHIRHMRRKPYRSRQERLRHSLTINLTPGVVTYNRERTQNLELLLEQKGFVPHFGHPDFEDGHLRDESPKHVAVKKKSPEPWRMGEVKKRPEIDRSSNQIYLCQLMKYLSLLPSSDLHAESLILFQVKKINKKNLNFYPFHKIKVRFLIRFISTLIEFQINISKN